MAENFRMYENQYPEVDDLVMVKVKSIAEMGAYVSLLEYGNHEGMILLSELSRRRIRSISKLIRVGRQEVVVVLRVDAEKGYIDLSKRRVSPEDIQRCEEKYNKSKSVHSILRHVAETTHHTIEELYTTIGWPLYRAFGHAYDAMMLAIHDPEAVFQKLQSMNIEVDPLIKEELISNIQRRLTPQPVKIRCDFEATCFTYEGIDAIKSALRAGEAVSTDAVPIKVTLIAPPSYVGTTMSLDRDAGIAALTACLEAIGNELKSRGGELNIKIPPRVISEKDDRQLHSLMERLELANREVAGDDDEEDGEDGGDFPATSGDAEA